MYYWRFALPLTLAVIVGCNRAQSETKPDVARDSASAKQPAKKTQEIVEQEYDFGQVQINSKNEHKFKITNTGKTPWTVKKVYISCSCVVSAMSSKTIAPGATEVATVRFTLGEKEGRFRQNMFLTFEEAESPTIQLGVLATVHHPISCSQEVVVLNPVRVGTREEQIIKVSNFSKEKWSDLAVDKTTKWIAVEMHKNSNAGELHGNDAPLQLWNVAIAVDGSGLSEGWNATTLNFHPRGHDKTRAKLMVRAYRIPAVSVEPSVVFCGIVERGKELQRTLRFSFRDSSEVPAIGDIKARVKKVPITLHWRKDSEDPAALVLETAIRTTGDTLNDDLEVDFGKGRTMRVPVRGSFRDAALQNAGPKEKEHTKAGQK